MPFAPHPSFSQAYMLAKEKTKQDDQKNPIRWIQLHAKIALNFVILYLEITAIREAIVT
jgi:hypothetical protein